MVIAIEQQSGFIVAGIVQPAWVAKLDATQRQIFDIALAGFYKLAAVDLVREQLVAVLGPSPYDISDEGLIVWPGDSYATELLYDLRAGNLAPIVRGPTVGIAAPSFIHPPRAVLPRGAALADVVDDVGDARGGRVAGPHRRRTRAATEGVTHMLARSRDGSEIYYEVSGDAAATVALVFVHGWMGNVRWWDAQRDAFAATHRVVALDLAGHGRSSRTRSAWSAEARTPRTSPAWCARSRPRASCSSGTRCRARMRSRRRRTWPGSSA